MTVEKRPNPRKVWPDPQKCVECKKNMRVVEIQFKTPMGRNTTSPTAPKDYIKSPDKFRAKLDKAWAKKGKR